MKQPDITKAKKKIALRIAEAISDEWPMIALEGYDVDEAARLVELFMPITLAEAEAEMDDGEDDSPPQPKKPSLFGQLRDALHYSEGANVGEVLTMATERLKAYRAFIEGLASDRDDRVSPGVKSAAIGILDTARRGAETGGGE